MSTKWINKNGNSLLILFFNGWGMDENTVAHLPSENFDILMFHRYHHKRKIPDITAYNKTYIIAWSLGVWAASKWMAQTSVKINRAVAINGTEHPIDDNRGIPCKTFENTLREWNEHNRNKFNTRILKSHKTLQQPDPIHGKRTIADQKKELHLLKTMINSEQQPNARWNTIIAGSYDLIFPLKNMKNAWNNNIKELPIPHYPFHTFNNWSQIAAT